MGLLRLKNYRPGDFWGETFLIFTTCHVDTKSMSLSCANCFKFVIMGNSELPDPEDPVRWSFRIPCGTKIARSPRRWKAEFFLAEGFQTGWYVTLPKDFVGIFVAL